MLNHHGTSYAPLLYDPEDPSGGWAVVESLIATHLELDLVPDEAVTRAIDIADELVRLMLELERSGVVLAIGDIDQLQLFVKATARADQKPIVVAFRAVEAWRRLKVKVGGGLELGVGVRVKRKPGRPRKDQG